MQILKQQAIEFMCVFINAFSNCDSTSCQQICNCRDDMIFCLDVTVPSFTSLPNYCIYFSVGYEIFQL